MLFKNLLIVYVACTAVIAIKYLLKAFMCKLYLWLVYRNVSGNSLKNLKYFEPVQKLLSKFGYHHTRKEILAFLTKDDSRTNIDMELFVVYGICISRSLSSPTWIFKAISSMSLFGWMSEQNIFVKIILFLAEFFAVYLLGLFLDTTGTGSKILTFLLCSANELFQQMKDIFP